MEHPTYKSVPHVRPLIPQSSVAIMIADTLFARENYGMKLRLSASLDSSKLPPKEALEHISLDEIRLSVLEAGYREPAISVMVILIYTRLMKKIIANITGGADFMDRMDTHETEMNRLYGVKFPEIPEPPPFVESWPGDWS